MPKRTILFVNGEMNDGAYLRGVIAPEDYLIAVDGGLHHLRALGLWPNLLIGDLDSITAQECEDAAQHGAEILQFPAHKDETDLELALLEAARRQFDVLLLAGMLGGRLDQTLANLFLLLLPELAGRDVRVMEPDQEISVIRQRAEIRGQVGDVVSLLPLQGDAEGVATAGLEYPLRDETLHADRGRGVSNRMASTRAEVSLKKGNLLCIHSWKNQKEKE